MHVCGLSTVAQGTGVSPKARKPCLAWPGWSPGFCCVGWCVCECGIGACVWGFVVECLYWTSAGRWNFLHWQQIHVLRRLSSCAVRKDQNASVGPLLTGGVFPTPSKSMCCVSFPSCAVRKDCPSCAVRKYQNDSAGPLLAGELSPPLANPCVA